MRKERKLSAYAKALADPKYRQRIVLAKKGRGSYNRKNVKVEKNA